MKQSNYWYNEGLKRANFRDLSGAIISLQRSLQYCRKNTAARNLLGLVYYGRGEMNEALVEWIISNNLNPTNNVASYYIQKVQKMPRELNRINSNIKKYNQCLQYCHQNAEDLAFIQMKKVVQEHPDFVKGYQLLALLSIRRGQFSRATEALKKAHRIDTTDGITLYYINELAEIKAQGKRSTEEKNRSVTYLDGNEMIIQPTSVTLKEDAGRVAIINIIIGILIGLAVMIFLIQPALDENEAMKNADAIREYSEQMNAVDAEINALQTELETYRTTNDEAELVIENSENIQKNYEMLSEIQLLYDGESTSDSKMAEMLVEVDITLLGEVGVEWYDQLVDGIVEPLCEDLYEEALEVYQEVSITEYADGTSIEYEESDYQPIITALEEIMDIYPAYQDYEAMSMLAETYVDIKDWENAKIYYDMISEQASDTNLIKEASEALVIVDEQLELSD